MAQQLTSGLRDYFKSNGNSVYTFQDEIMDAFGFMTLILFQELEVISPNQGVRGTCYHGNTRSVKRNATVHLSSTYKKFHLISGSCRHSPRPNLYSNVKISNYSIISNRRIPDPEPSSPSVWFLIGAGHKQLFIFKRDRMAGSLDSARSVAITFYRSTENGIFSQNTCNLVKQDNDYFYQQVYQACSSTDGLAACYCSRCLGFRMPNCMT